LEYGIKSGGREEYLVSFLFEAVSAALPAEWDVECRYESTRVLTTVTSHVINYFTNDEVLRRVDLGSLSEIVRQKRLRFAGHILRLPENRPAYMAVNWQPDNGRRRPGRPTKTWRTTFNEDLHDMGLTWMCAKRSASDRPK